MSKHKAVKTNTVHVSKIFITPDGESEILGVFKNRRKAVGVVRAHLRHLYDNTNAQVYIQNSGSWLTNNLRTTEFEVATDRHPDQFWIPECGAVEEVLFFE